MNYFIPQMDSSDCGFACLKMMIARLYENEKALYIKQDEHHGAYNFLELVDKASNYGITLEGVEIEQKEEIKSIKLPFIALIKKKNDLFHYVLVTKVKFGTIYYSDPDEGESFCTKKGFFSIWTGTSLIIKDFKKEDGLIFTSDDVCKNNKSFAVALLQIFTSLFLATGIYFIDEKTKIFVPLLFLLFALISEIILRIVLIKKMEKFDDDFMTGLNIERRDFYRFYVRLEDYKKKSIINSMNVIFSFIIIIFLSVVVLLNNIYNVFLILIPLLLSIIDIRFVRNSIKSKDELISIEENEIRTLKNIDTFKSQVNKLHLRGYKLAKITLLKKYIYLAILMVVALLTTVFNETFSLPYVIFYFAIGYMIFEQFENFMLYPHKEKERLRSKAKLYNITNRI